MWYADDCVNQIIKYFILIFRKLQIYSNYEKEVYLNYLYLVQIYSKKKSSVIQKLCIFKID